MSPRVQSHLKTQCWFVLLREAAVKSIQGNTFALRGQKQEKKKKKKDLKSLKKL